MPSLPYILALRTLETLVNQALRHDPATRQRLTALAGKLIHIETEAPALQVMIEIQGERIRLTPESRQTPHVTIEAHTLELLRLAISQQPQLIGGPLRVQGQVQVLEQLQGIARQLDIDWEAPLAAFFGDVAGHQLGQRARGLFDFARTAARTFVRNSTEYLQEERALLPVRWEVDELTEAAEDLRADSDRLQARLDRLGQRLNRLETST